MSDLTKTPSFPIGLYRKSIDNLVQIRDQLKSNENCIKDVDNDFLEKSDSPLLLDMFYLFRTCNNESLAKIIDYLIQIKNKMPVEKCEHEYSTDLCYRASIYCDVCKKFMDLDSSVIYCKYCPNRLLPHDNKMINLNDENCSIICSECSSK